MNPVGKKSKTINVFIKIWAVNYPFLVERQSLSQYIIIISTIHLTTHVWLRLLLTNGKYVYMLNIIFTF